MTLVLHTKPLSRAHELLTITRLGSGQFGGRFFATIFVILRSGAALWSAGSRLCLMRSELRVDVVDVGLLMIVVWSVANAVHRSS